MEDLAFYIEFAEDRAYFLSTPELRIFDFECCCSWFPVSLAQLSQMPLSLIKAMTSPHNFSKKSLDYWRLVVEVMADYINEELKVTLAAWLGLHFLRLLIETFSCWAIEISIAVDDIECNAIEANRDPPSIFIPLPKIESTNGCARSDLPIRSLIF